MNQLKQRILGQQDKAYNIYLSDPEAHAVSVEDIQKAFGEAKAKNHKDFLTEFTKNPTGIEIEWNGKATPKNIWKWIVENSQYGERGKIKDELEKIYKELKSDAYNEEYHTYDYKITNQIIRRAFERLYRASCEKCKHKNVCCQNVLFALGGWDSEKKELIHCSRFEPSLANPVKIPISSSAYKKQGEFETVGELKKLLEPFQDEMPIGFINQPKQDLYLSIDLEYGSQLGFQ